MSDETYYTVLNIKETASASEIKTAYRDLIKQVHPDTVSNLAPYLRKIAEDKAKEITEAYTVLSNASKRRDYDRQLAEYRRQTIPQAPSSNQYSAQQASSTSSGYCTRCGTSLYVSGYCPKCSKFATPTATAPPRQAAGSLGYKWGRWAREHPIIALAIPFLILLIAALAPSDTSPQGTGAGSGNAAVTPVKAVQSVVPQASAPAMPAVSVSGAYTGTVHNQTANLSSTVTVVIEASGGQLSGCVDVKPPLYGSGALHGSIRGQHISFTVADITFQGDASQTGIVGSYLVARQEGNQLGDFRLSKASGERASYDCASGVVIQFEAADAPTAKPKPVAKAPAAIFAIVTGRYGATVYKRCAFLPSDNYGRCNFEPQKVAQLRQGDRVRVLSPLTRAQNGEDIYKVRTQQGWEGWARAEEITLEQQ